MSTSALHYRRALTHPIKLVLMGLILGASIFAVRGEQAAFAQDQQQPALVKIAEDFAKALSNADKDALKDLVVPGYYAVLAPSLGSAQLGDFRSLKASVQVLDRDTGCFYLRRDLAGSTLISLITCRKEGTNWRICHGDIRTA